MKIALGSINHWSYPSWPSHLDHIIISNELFNAFNHNASNVQTILIEELMGNNLNNYLNIISDHRPVSLTLYLKK